MKNRMLFFCVASIILINILSLASAANETQNQDQINKAYNWLSNSVRDKYDSIGIEETSLTLLALAYDDNLATQARDNLLSKSTDNKCWPSSACKAKDTAQAVMALSRIGVDTSKAEEWLMAQNGTPTDLTWFMQIDTPEDSICTLSYDTSNYNVTLNTKKKLNKAAGLCLSLSYGNYWFKISSACYDKKFTINCDKDFVTSLFYQKPGSTTLYISSDTKRETAKNDAELKISSVCIKQEGSCNYEATAWTALSLIKKSDIGIFLPYLVGYNENNKKYLPDAFLYALTGQEDYANALVSIQKKAGYWQADSTPYDKYYDTALAMLALKEYTSEKKNVVLTWLLNEQVKSGETDGSWQGSKKDTAFVLYSVWPKEASYVPGVTELKCRDYNYFCEQSYNCDFDNRLPDYTCDGLQVCCDTAYEEKTRGCSEEGGSLCDSSLNLICQGFTKSATDGTCCMGECIPETVNECATNDGVCRTSCEIGEKKVSDSCPYSSDVCCAQGGEIKPKSNMGWLIFLLVLIIIAAIVGFLFRDKISDNFKKKPPRSSPPSFGSGRMPPRYAPSAAPPKGRPQPQPPARMAQPPNRFLSFKRTQTDKDLEDTLKKLKDISDK